MPARRPKSRRLTVYLLKEGRTTEEGALTNSGGVVRRSVPGIGELYVKASTLHPPGWVDLFEGAVDLSGIRLTQANASAVLLATAGERVFALTFGYGRALLEPGCWEERFGLRVTLNSLDPGKVRSIDKQSFDAIARHSREQASRHVSADAFGLNIEQDMLRAAAGTPTDPTLGTRMTGMDALNVAVKTDLRSVPHLLGRYLEQYQSQAYRERYPWVDRISEVEDPALWQELDEVLAHAIRSGDGAVWMAVPEIIEWTDVAGFRYSQSNRFPLRDDLSTADFLTSVRDPDSLTAESLRRRRVHCFSESSGMVTRKWPVYRCLYYEADRNGRTYILTDGKWYAVHQDFVAEVDAGIGSIQPSSLNLPAYDDASEDAYNRRLAAREPARFALMHENQIPRGGGSSTIEFCDLYGSERHMVHVKRYAGSSVLSHLFAQGLVSAELLYLDPPFRARVNELLPDTHKLENPGRPLQPERYPVVFAIVSREDEELRLPFFSRVNLYAAAKRLRGFGYPVHLDRVLNIVGSSPA